MAERIEKLYRQGRINADGVKAAMDRGLITAEECDRILMIGAELKAEGV